MDVQAAFALLQRATSGAACMQLVLRACSTEASDTPSCTLTRLPAPLYVTSKPQYMPHRQVFNRCIVSMLYPTNTQNQHQSVLIELLAILHNFISSQEQVLEKSNGMIGSRTESVGNTY
jgi:hypothetical protein